MGAGDHVAQGDRGKGGVVTEHLHTPAVGQDTGHAAGNTAEAPGTCVTTFTLTLDRLAVGIISGREREEAKLSAKLSCIEQCTANTLKFCRKPTVEVKRDDYVSLQI